MKIYYYNNIVKLIGFEATQIYVIGVKGEKIIFPKINNEIIINLDELLKEDLILKRQLRFYDATTNSMIEITNDVEIIRDKKLDYTSFVKEYVESLEHQLTPYIEVYIDREGVLSLIKNQLPSNSLWYNAGAQITNITSNSNTLEVEFSFNTSFFKPTTLYIFANLRNGQRREEIKGKLLHSTPIEKNIFKNTAKFILNLEEIRDIIPLNQNLKNYVHYVLDIDFTFSLQEFNHLYRHYKLRFSKLCENKNLQEIWLKNDENSSVLIRPYSTQKNTYSMRVSYVPNDIVEYYRNHEKIRQKNEKPVIVVYEYPEKAQENGLEFFKYLMENYSNQYEIYFLIGEFSLDLHNLEEYSDNVVFFRTKEHIDLLFKADILCHTHTSYFFLPFQTPDLVELLKSKKRVFLQHGVLGARNLKSMYGRNINDWITDLFVVSSDREKSIVEDYGFSDEEIVVSGLPRFDKLISKRSSHKNILQKKQLLIMPTWRPNHAHMTDEQFIHTNYFFVFDRLLNHSKFEMITKVLNYEVIFYQHRNFQRFNHLFHSNYVEIVNSEEKLVQDLLLECDVLITDYSSVGLDFALMDKKVIYLQPNIITNKQIRSTDKRFFPGPIYKEFESIAKELTSTKLSKKYREKIPFIYKYNDTNARERIVNKMKKTFNI